MAAAAGARHPPRGGNIRARDRGHRTDIEADDVLLDPVRGVEPISLLLVNRVTQHPGATTEVAKALGVRDHARGRRHSGTRGLSFHAVRPIEQLAPRPLVLEHMAGEEVARVARRRLARFGVELALHEPRKLFDERRVSEQGVGSRLRIGGRDQLRARRASRQRERESSSAAHARRLVGRLVGGARAGRERRDRHQRATQDHEKSASHRLPTRRTTARGWPACGERFGRDALTATMSG